MKNRHAIIGLGLLLVCGQAHGATATLEPPRTSAGMRSLLIDELGDGPAVFNNADGVTLDQDITINDLTLTELPSGNQILVGIGGGKFGVASSSTNYVAPAPVMLFDSSTGAMIAYGNSPTTGIETDPAAIGVL